MKFVILTKKKIIAVTAIVIALIITFIILSNGAYSVFYGYATKKLPIYRVDGRENLIAISFDCAWGVDYTDSLLETMRTENVKCTFFTVEFWAEKYPEYLKKIDAEGHEIGTHSATHPYMSKLSKSAIEKELITSSHAIERVIGKKVEVFRAPYGDYNDLLINTAIELGLYVIQWDVDSLDWKDLSAEEIENRVVSRVKSGSIVLFHNQGKYTHKALPSLIKTLKKKGYTFTTVGELIYRENYKMLPDGTQISNV